VPVPIELLSNLKIVWLTTPEDHIYADTQLGLHSHQLGLDDWI